MENLNQSRQKRAKKNRLNMIGKKHFMLNFYRILLHKNRKTSLVIGNIIFVCIFGDIISCFYRRLFDLISLQKFKAKWTKRIWLWIKFIRNLCLRKTHFAHQQFHLRLVHCNRVTVETFSFVSFFSLCLLYRSIRWIAR